MKVEDLMDWGPASGTFGSIDNDKRPSIQEYGRFWIASNSIAAECSIEPGGKRGWIESILVIGRI
jgi:hypothetical protein